MKTVILIGDSIRAGYQPTVAAELSDVADVWGPEQNGGDSNNVLTHLHEWVIERKADLVHINCGLHDCKRDINNENIQVPLEDYKDNLYEIFRRVTEETDSRMLWTLTTPVNEENHRTLKNFVRLNSDIEACNLAARQIAAQYDVPVNDLHAFVNDIGPERILQPDGVHYTEGGYKALGKTVAAFIGNHL